MVVVVVVAAALRLDVVVVVERPTVLPLPVFPREGVEDVDAPLPPRDDELGVVVRRVVDIRGGHKGRIRRTGEQWVGGVIITTTTIKGFFPIYQRNTIDAIFITMFTPFLKERAIRFQFTYQVRIHGHGRTQASKQAQSTEERK